MSNLREIWKNDPDLLRLARYQPPGCRTQLIRGIIGTVAGSIGAVASGNSIEIGAIIGGSAGVIIPQIPHTVDAIIVDFRVISRIVYQVKTDGRKSK